MKKIITVIAAVILAASSITCSAADTGSTKGAANEERVETLSAIGSVSKNFTAVAAMQLAERGLLDIDAPVTDYIPEFTMADERYKDITVRMLMNHTSGLMGFTCGNMLTFDDVCTDDHDHFLEMLSTQRLKADPGAVATYSNDGFELLELVVERVSGMSYTDYIEEYICKPLGLEQTGTPLKNYGQENTAKLLMNGKTEFATDYCNGFGTGGIYSTASELCTYGSAFFTGDETMLSEKSKAEMNKNYARSRYEDGFGLGWDNAGFPEYDEAGVKVIVKGGHTLEQSTSLMIAPDEEISIAVMTAEGESMGPSYMGIAILDTILEDRGISIEHSEPENMTVVDIVPEKYLSKADIYASASGVYSVSFPEGKHMEIVDLTADNPRPMQYMYTADDNFVLMEGTIGSGKEKQAEDQVLLKFVENDGKEYICRDTNTNPEGFSRFLESTYYMQRTGVNNVSEDLQQAWEARSGKKYYLSDAKYSNGSYLATPCITLMTANGYVYGKLPDRSNDFVSAITDKDTALAFIEMNGYGGSNLKDIKIDTADGCEVLDLTNYELRYTEESSIPRFSSDIHEIALEKGKAKWYNIGDMGGASITLDIPENASVYVYDKYDNIVYSSYIKNYGSEVTLPEEGKIVFVGEDGAKVDIG